MQIPILDPQIIETSPQIPQNIVSPKSRIHQPRIKHNHSLWKGNCQVLLKELDIGHGIMSNKVHGSTILTAKRLCNIPFTLLEMDPLRRPMVECIRHIGDKFPIAQVSIFPYQEMSRRNDTSSSSSIPWPDKHRRNPNLSRTIMIQLITLNIHTNELRPSAPLPRLKNLLPRHIKLPIPRRGGTFQFLRSLQAPRSTLRKPHIHRILSLRIHLLERQIPLPGPQVVVETTRQGRERDLVGIFDVLF